MKRFKIPSIYESGLIKGVHAFRDKTDPRKKDFRATELNFGTLKFIVARSFGFCYGVENAVERSYRAVNENPGKNIYLLSQMIHNPDVNADLLSQGIRFIMDTSGNQLIEWDTITSDDIVIIPAFGTSVETKSLLTEKGIEFKTYDTTCPFVTRVWKRAEQLGTKNYNLIIHGKYNHEETKATFSHSLQNAEAIVVKDMREAKLLADFVKGDMTKAEFTEIFAGKYSDDFDPEIHLEHVGVINQTTMLATETAEIAEYISSVYKEKYGENYKKHIADTRDTLCYATNENQDSTIEMLKNKADIAIVVGGYNSSNTSHLVELCEEKLPTYYIANADEIKSDTEIHHFNFRTKEMHTTNDFLKGNTSIMITCGASCPDSVLNAVIEKIISYYPDVISQEEALENLQILN